MLEAIETLIEDQGYSPSVRQIGKHMGLTSPSTVHHHLKKLADDGYIKHNPKIARSIVVLKHLPWESA